MFSDSVLNALYLLIAFFAFHFSNMALVAYDSDSDTEEGPQTKRQKLEPPKTEPVQQSEQPAQTDSKASVKTAEPAAGKSETDATTAAPSAQTPGNGKPATPAAAKPRLPDARKMLKSGSRAAPSFLQSRVKPETDGELVSSTAALTTALQKEIASKMEESKKLSKKKRELQTKSAEAAAREKEREREQVRKKHYEGLRKAEKEEQALLQIEVMGHSKGLHKWH